MDIAEKLYALTGPVRAAVLLAFSQNEASPEGARQCSSVVKFGTP